MTCLAYKDTQEIVEKSTALCLRVAGKIRARAIREPRSFGTPSTARSPGSR